MSEYTVVCPNSLEKDGVSVNIKFTYTNLEKAIEHKTLCDNWAIKNNKESLAYIVEETEQRGSL